jgi:hypothetical protein
MANVNIPDLAALTAPAATDEIEVYDASAAANVRLALSYVALTGTANAFTATRLSSVTARSKLWQQTHKRRQTMAIYTVDTNNHGTLRTRSWRTKRPHSFWTRGQVGLMFRTRARRPLAKNAALPARLAAGGDLAAMAEYHTKAACWDGEAVLVKALGDLARGSGDAEACQGHALFPGW